MADLCICRDFSSGKAGAALTFPRRNPSLDTQEATVLETQMPKLVLYHAAPSRSSIVHWMLEELGQPFELQIISFKKRENREPAFLAVNPMGKVPALKHGETVITEAAAICTYLADEFPQAGLNVPVGDPRRGTYLKWLFFGPSCVEPAIAERAFPRKEEPSRAALGFGDFDTVVDVLAKAATAASPYLLGKQFTAADVIIGSGLRWGTMFKLLPERPEFKEYLAALAERPALRRATEKDAQLQKAQEQAS
jgi:glutathione S-transferase